LRGQTGKKCGNARDVGREIYQGIVWCYEEKSRRSEIVEMLDVVNLLPVGRVLKRKNLKFDTDADLH